MCKPIQKSFLCICAYRNTPRCSHSRYVRPRAESSVQPDDYVVDGGWYTRMGKAGQTHMAWKSYARGWEHCIQYRLSFAGEDMELTEGFEGKCPDDEVGNQTGEEKTVWTMGLRQECMEEKIAYVTHEISNTTSTNKLAFSFQQGSSQPRSPSKDKQYSSK
ncbi:hypothetical protein BT67DRAFT_378094 [Trichocladium antarcticum]|uniref:Uncharacterized protein n=1 Tax=Trichocladium antarcticum TaxID=1450529 RepID=A0AAN6UPI6_9PEZI|nr:hypothetical protein BT67DRAFT_378094 [Trichocladium antarcticum]